MGTLHKREAWLWIMSLVGIIAIAVVSLILIEVPIVRGGLLLVAVALLPAPVIIFLGLNERPSSLVEEVEQWLRNHQNQAEN